MTESVPVIAPVPRGRPPGKSGSLRKQAQALEALLFEEMLKAARTRSPGLGSSFGGESQFDSLLRSERARLVSAAGRTGLAEVICRSLSGASCQGQDAQIARHTAPLSP